MRRMKGTGSIVQKRGKYHARRRLNGRDIYGPARETRDEAEQDRLVWNKAAITPKTKKEVPTLEEWAYLCMRGRYGKKLAEETFDTNEIYRHRFINGSKIGSKRLVQVTRADCQEFVDSIRKKDGTKPSPSYLHRVAALISKLFSLAVFEGYILINPMRGVELPKIPERQNRTLSPEEALKLLNPQTRTDCLILVAMMCGLRRKELIRLKWEHVDFEIGLIHVPGTKTAKSLRVVPMTQEVKQAIEKQPRRCEYVFSTQDGKSLGTRNVNRDINLRKSELGIPARTRLQDLRGSFVSLLVEQGQDVRTIMELVGHADPRTTLKMYARSRPEVKKKALETLRSSILGTRDRGNK